MRKYRLTDPVSGQTKTIQAEGDLSPDDLDDISAQLFPKATTTPAAKAPAVSSQSRFTDSYAPVTSSTPAPKPKATVFLTGPDGKPYSAPPPMNPDVQQGQDFAAKNTVPLSEPSSGALMSTAMLGAGSSIGGVSAAAKSLQGLRTYAAANGLSELAGSGGGTEGKEIFARHAAKSATPLATGVAIAKLVGRYTKNPVLIIGSMVAAGLETDVAQEAFIKFVQGRETNDKENTRDAELSQKYPLSALLGSQIPAIAMFKPSLPFSKQGLTMGALNTAIGAGTRALTGSPQDLGASAADFAGGAIFSGGETPLGERVLSGIPGPPDVNHSLVRSEVGRRVTTGGATQVRKPASMLDLLKPPTPSVSDLVTTVGKQPIRTADALEAGKQMLHDQGHSDAPTVETPSPLDATTTTAPEATTPTPVQPPTPDVFAQALEAARQRRATQEARSEAQALAKPEPAPLPENKVPEQGTIPTPDATSNRGTVADTGIHAPTVQSGTGRTTSPSLDLTPKIPPPSPGQDLPGTFRTEVHNPADVGIDPQMQYKTSEVTDQKNKVSTKLKGTDTYDVDQGGAWTVYRGEDGEIVAVNSHHRRELANRAKQFIRVAPDGSLAEMPRAVPMRVLDAKDGWTPEKARAYGALENIRDNKGTALDALDVMHELGIKEDQFSKYGISLTSDLTRNIQGMATLSPNAVGRVRMGDLPEAVAAGVGSVKGLNPEAQEGAIHEAASRNYGTFDKGRDLGQEYLQDQQDGTLSRESGQQDLFGGEYKPPATSTRGIRVELKNGVSRELVKAYNDLNAPTRIKTRSNETIDVKARREEAAQLGESSRAVKERAGLLMNQDATKARINQLAKDVADGKTTSHKAIVTLAEELRPHVGKSLNEILNPGGSRPPITGTTAESAGGSGGGQDTPELDSRGVAPTTGGDGRGVTDLFGDAQAPEPPIRETPPVVSPEPAKSEQFPDAGFMLKDAKTFGEVPSQYPAEIGEAFKRWANDPEVSIPLGQHSAEQVRARAKWLKSLPMGTRVVVMHPDTEGYIAPRTGVIAPGTYKTPSGKEYAETHVLYDDGGNNRQHAAKSSANPLFIEPLDKSLSMRGKSETAKSEQVATPEKSARFEAGKNLTPEEKATVLRSMGDSYKDLNAPKVEKGVSQSGDMHLGYEYNPDYMHVSDITGRSIRHYVTLPDGRRAHPTEIYPDLTPAEIDKEFLRQEAEARQVAPKTESREERIAEPGDKAKAEANQNYSKKGRVREGSFFAKDEKGRIVRVDGTDKEDWPYYEAQGFKAITQPVVTESTSVQEPASKPPISEEKAPKTAVSAQKGDTGTPTEPKPTDQLLFTGDYKENGGYTVPVKNGDIITKNGQEYVVNRVSGFMLGVDKMTADGPKVDGGINISTDPVTHTGRNHFDEMKEKARVQSETEHGVITGKESDPIFKKRQQLTDDLHRAEKAVQQLAAKGDTPFIEMRNARDKVASINRELFMSQEAFDKWTKLANAPKTDTLTNLAESAQARIDARAEKNKGSGTVGTGLGGASDFIENLPDYAIIGAAHIRDGARSSAEFAKAMIGEFGEAIRPHLGAIEAEARKVHAHYFPEQGKTKEAGKTTIDTAPATKTVTPESPKETAQSPAPVETKPEPTAPKEQVRQLKMADMEEEAKRLGTSLPDRSTFKTTWEQDRHEAETHFDQLLADVRTTPQRSAGQLTRAHRIAAFTYLKHIEEVVQPSLIKQIEEAESAGKTAEANQLRDQLTSTIDQYSDLSNKLYFAGSEAGRDLNLQRIFQGASLDVGAWIKKATTLKGRDLSLEATRTITEMVTKAARVKTKIDAARDAGANAAEQRLMTRPKHVPKVFSEANDKEALSFLKSVDFEAEMKKLDTANCP